MASEMLKHQTAHNEHDAARKLHVWSKGGPAHCQIAQRTSSGICVESLAQAGAKIQAGGQGTVVAVQDPGDGLHLAVKYIATDQKRAKHSETAAVSRHAPGRVASKDKMHKRQSAASPPGQLTPPHSAHTRHAQRRLG